MNRLCVFVTFYSFELAGRHKTRLHIGQLVKDTSSKLKQASEADHHTEVSVSKYEMFYLYKQMPGFLVMIIEFAFAIHCVWLV